MPGPKLGHLNVLWVIEGGVLPIKSLIGIPQFFFWEGDRVAFTILWFDILQETSISYFRKRKNIFKSAFQRGYVWSQEGIYFWCSTIATFLLVWWKIYRFFFAPRRNAIMVPGRLSRQRSRENTLGNTATTHSCSIERRNETWFGWLVKGCIIIPLISLDNQGTFILSHNWQIG